ncbi:hypothetical protein CVU37_02075 [candidate division BRC1 bacterium HGW-BRC1-1]|jgi:hypothetical protein|nr:MAG: hypothetical protein CVU37_02075 [candidate division BRC1 bacterium HGW-BRC1-1]
MSVFFEETIITSRPYREYCDMFALTTGDLHDRRILDCGAGGSSFCAEGRALGMDITAADPHYDLAGEQMAELARAGMDRANRFITENIRNYTWRYFADMADYNRTRTESTHKFIDHYQQPASHGMYVAAGLPELPFEDGEFDLSLCGHFLFTYADRLDFDFHEAALRELVRVSRDQVRVFPLLDRESHACEFVKDLRDALLGDGIHSAVMSVPYEFQDGGNEMLVLQRRTFR